MAYVTNTEIESYTGLIIESTVSAFIVTAISAAEKYIEKYTGRIFDDADTSQTLYYDGNGTHKLTIHDLRTLTSLVVDGVTLTANTDFYLYPLNASFDGLPSEWIELITPETKLINGSNSRMSVTSRYVFREAQRNVAITGKWGFSTTPPDDIKLAALKLIGAVIKENITDNDAKELNSESLTDYSVSYTKIADIAHALKVDDILDQYVRKLPYNSNKPLTGTIKIS